MNENKYINSKIYKIICNITGEIYYGSTYQTLSKRLKGHVSDTKHIRQCISKQIILRGDYNIALVEDYPCLYKKELREREGYYQLNNPCINKVIAGRNLTEWLKTEKGKASDKKRRNKYRNTDKDIAAQNRNSENRRVKINCPICMSCIQVREWYKHLQCKLHMDNELKHNIKYCKCGGKILADHESSKQHIEWLTGGNKAIVIS